jgi:hypothetical protein
MVVFFVSGNKSTTRNEEPLKRTQFNESARKLLISKYGVAATLIEPEADNYRFMLSTNPVNRP